MVGDVRHPTAADEVAEAILQDATATLDQLRSTAGQSQQAPIPGSLQPCHFKKPIVSQNGHHPTRGRFGLT
jgi:hypothetical protein